MQHYPSGEWFYSLRQVLTIQCALADFVSRLETRRCAAISMYSINRRGKKLYIPARFYDAYDIYEVSPQSTVQENSIM